MSGSENDTEVVTVESENVVVANVVETEVVVTSDTINRIEVDIIDAVEPKIEVVGGDIAVQVFQGDVFFATIDEEILSGVVKRTDFTVVSTVVYDTYSYSLPSDARTLLHVMINQIDFVKWCAIDPVGSGQVVYTVPVNGYHPEAGDVALIYWLR